MDAVWDSGDPLTSAEILDRIDEKENLDMRTERVLLHHLCKKGVLGYTVDERDSRVYHYYPLRTREESFMATAIALGLTSAVTLMKKGQRQKDLVFLNQRSDNIWSCRIASLSYWYRIYSKHLRCPVQG